MQYNGPHFSPPAPLVPRLATAGRVPLTGAPRPTGVPRITVKGRFLTTGTVGQPPATQPGRAVDSSAFLAVNEQGTFADNDVAVGAGIAIGTLALAALGGRFLRGRLGAQLATRTARVTGRGMAMADNTLKGSLDDIARALGTSADKLARGGLRNLSDDQLRALSRSPGLARNPIVVAMRAGQEVGAQSLGRRIIPSLGGRRVFGGAAGVTRTIWKGSQITGLLFLATTFVSPETTMAVLEALHSYIPLSPKQQEAVSKAMCSDQEVRSALRQMHVTVLEQSAQTGQLSAEARQTLERTINGFDADCEKTVLGILQRLNSEHGYNPASAECKILGFIPCPDFWPLIKWPLIIGGGIFGLWFLSKFILASAMAPRVSVVDKD